MKGNSGRQFSGKGKGQKEGASKNARNRLTGRKGYPRTKGVKQLGRKFPGGLQAESSRIAAKHSMSYLARWGRKRTVLR